MSSSTIAGQTELRREQRDKIRALGADPYAEPEADFSFKLINADFASLPELDAANGQCITAVGRLLRVNDLGKLKFAHVQTQHGFIQAVFSSHRVVGVCEQLKLAAPGDFVSIVGVPCKTKKPEKALLAYSLRVVTKALRPLPTTQTTSATPEWLAANRVGSFLRDPSRLSRAVMKSDITRELREALWCKGFREVETRVLLETTGGASAKPFMTRCDALGREMSLRVSTELDLKRLIVAGLNRVFEIGKVFRNEGIDATHSPEFTSLELYAVNYALRDGIALCIELVERVAPTFRHDGSHSREIREATMRELVREACPDSPISELTEPSYYEIDSLPEYARHKLRREFHCYGDALQALFDSFVDGSQSFISQPIIVTEHPSTSSPLARCRGHFADRFELYVSGMEVANGYVEQSDPDEQRRVMREQAESGGTPADESYCDDLELGLPPTFGLGIGVDRVAMLAAKTWSISDVTPLPLGCK